MTTPDQLFEDIEKYRAVLSTETDDGSPDNENTYGAIRNCIEALTMHAGGVVVTMTLTSDPNDDNDGIATDSSLAMTADQYIGFLAIVLDGDGIGNIFYIQDNAATTITCYTNLRGEGGGITPNLYTAGIRSGDKIGIFYHFMTANHDHDGINSTSVVLAKSSIRADRLQDGTVTVMMNGGSLERSTTADTWTTLHRGKIYIPADARKLSGRIQFRQQSHHVVFYVYVRIRVGGIASASQRLRASNVLTWMVIEPFDISSLSGWQTVELQGRTDIGGPACVIGGASLAFVG